MLSYRRRSANLYIMHFNFVLFLCFIVSITADCPNIVKRSEWNAKPAKSQIPLQLPVNVAVIHHTVSPDVCTTKVSCIKAVQSIQNYHQGTRGWLDIGYNFLVGGDGNVYEGRGWSVRGTHAPGYNSKSIGIALIGDFTNKAPTQNMVDAAQKLLECGQSKNYLRASYKLHGHRQVTKTACPGDKFYPLLQSWPHYATV